MVTGDRLRCHMGNFNPCQLDFDCMWIQDQTHSTPAPLTSLNSGLMISLGGLLLCMHIRLCVVGWQTVDSFSWQLSVTDSSSPSCPRPQTLFAITQPFVCGVSLNQPAFLTHVTPHLMTAGFTASPWWVIMAGVYCINKPLAAEFTFWKTEFLFALQPSAIFFYLLFSVWLFTFSTADIRSSQPPPSFHLPLPLFHPLFHTMSIPLGKGHPGNREAVVDIEINKQKKRERSDGKLCLVIFRVNYRPTF